MHETAYKWTKDVMNGVETFGEYDFGNLYNKVKFQYEPDFRLDSFGTPQMVKIIKAGKVDEDYILEWLEASTPDHTEDILGEFNKSATSVYFSTRTNEIIFT